MPSRRSFLTAVPAAAFIAPSFLQANEPKPSPTKVRYCLNMSTVRGHKLSVPEQIDLAASAGYDGIEPWIRDVRKHVDEGGSLADLKSRIDDAGLLVESAIGFAKWAVNDNAERAAGLNEFRSDMELLKAIGGTRIAAPPVGMHAADAGELNLDDAAERLPCGSRVGTGNGRRAAVGVLGAEQKLVQAAASDVRRQRGRPCRRLFASGYLSLVSRRFII